MPRTHPAPPAAVVPPAADGAAGQRPLTHLPAACRNCATPLHGPYCAVCGQRDAPTDPSLRELLGEAWDAIVDVDGRMLVSLRLLLSRPGALTAHYLVGRRAAFVPPFRLYLACSLAFFLLQAVLPDPDRALHVNTKGTVTGVADPLSADDAAAGVAGPEFSRRVQRGMRRASVDETGFAERMLDRAPQVVFVLVPVQALLLAAAYRRRPMRLPAHLVFALHGHAFFFVALGAMGAAAALGPTALHEWSDPLAAAVVAGYTLLAMRRVYGGRWSTTIARGIVIGAGYLVGALLVMGALLIITFYRMGAPAARAEAPAGTGAPVPASVTPPSRAAAP